MAEPIAVALRMAEPVAVDLRVSGDRASGGLLEQLRAQATNRVIAPLDLVELVTSLQPVDVLGTVLLAISLAVGPGPWLAPLGIATETRPIRQAALGIARVSGQSGEPWARDAMDGLAFTPPIPIIAGLVLLFGAAGLLTERILLLVFDNALEFTVSLSGSLAIAALTFEVIRPKLQSRADYEREQTTSADFEKFAAEQLVAAAGTSCHESDIVRSFRTWSPKYRSSSGRVEDIDIERTMRRWGRVQRSPAGYYQGLRLKPSAISSVF